MFCAVFLCCLNAWLSWISSTSIPFSSVSESCLDSSRPQGLQHTRLPCQLPTPGAYSNSCPLHKWFHPTISSYVIPFSSCLQSFPASGSFQLSQFFASGAKVLEFQLHISSFNEYSELISIRIDWFDLLAVQGTLKSLLQHHRSKASVLWHSTFFMAQLSCPYMTAGKTIALTVQTFGWQSDVSTF